MGSGERCDQAIHVTWVGLIVNLVLTVFKLVAGIIGNSTAMIADAFHSASDLISDLVIILGFRISSRPGDKTHNYGHGKVETLCMVFVGMLLFVAGYQILVHGIQNIIMFTQGQIIEPPTWIVVGAAVISIVSKEFMYHYTINISQRINSGVLLANAWHHRSDALSSVGMAIGLGGSIVLGGKWTLIDPIMAVALSLLLFYVAFRITYRSANELVEASLDEKTNMDILNIITSTKGIIDCRDIKTRKIGTCIAVDVCVIVDVDLSLIEAHMTSNNVVDRIKKTYGYANYVFVKTEPYGVETCQFSDSMFESH